MANVRQMPELYLRGSLANITMKNLLPHERQHVEELAKKIWSHPDMLRHKVKVMKELGVTIAADYANDRDIAEEEYKIAIWRGVVDLFYHRQYTFECRACRSATYLTKRSKPKTIDRIQVPCPNCHMVEVDDPGDVVSLHAGEFLTQDAFQASYQDMPDGFRPPISKSTITYVAGPRKYENPQAIIDDDRQLRKFFGEFVWNYFRQQINENKRKAHRKDHIPILGRTDEIIVQEILSLCTQMGVDFNYCAKTEPRNSKYTINIMGVMTAPEFTVEFGRLKDKAALYGVEVATTRQTIEIDVNPDAAPLPILHRADKRGKQVAYQALVVRPEHVNMLDNLSNISDEQDNDFNLSQVDHRTVGGCRMDQENHVETVDVKEAFLAVRDALPDGNCRAVFDILSQTGDIYLRFSDTYGDGEPKVNHIASFLGITTRAVNNHKQDIEVHLHYRGLVPTG